MANGLSLFDWLKWTVATVVASLTMIIGVLAFGSSLVYPRSSGEAVEERLNRIDKRADNYDERTYQRLVILEDKIDNLREMWLRKQIQK